MGKRYSRSRSYRNSSGPNPIGLLIIAAFIFLYQYWKTILTIALIIGAILLVYYIIRHKNQPEIAPSKNSSFVPQSSVEPPEYSHQLYSPKESIMTECEKAFFEVFKEIVGPRYTVQPQINLASVIDKESHSRYRNELFRNIDFGVFDEKYALVLLIEINDQSHTMQNRIDRDNKVKSICEDAGIPLITFWTKYGIDKQYIYNRLLNYLPLLIETEKPCE